MVVKLMVVKYYSVCRNFSEAHLRHIELPQDFNYRLSSHISQQDILIIVFFAQILVLRKMLSLMTIITNFKKLKNI